MLDAVLYVFFGLLLLIIGVAGGVCTGVMFLGTRAVDDTEARMCLGFLALCSFAMSVVCVLFGVWLITTGILLISR